MIGKYFIRGSVLIFLLGILLIPSSASANCTSEFPRQCYAVSEVIDAGTFQGSFADTFSADGIYEMLTEQDATVGPPPKRADLMQIIWTLPVPQGNSYRFFVTGHRVDTGGDGDDFSFAYSTDNGLSWSTMEILANDSPDLTYQYDFTSDMSGSLLIRATDTDRSKGNKNHASLFVDHLYVEVSLDDPPPDPGPGPGVSEKRIVGYYTSWSIYARDYFVSNIPGDKVTHINYAFANLQPDGTVVLGDPFADVNKQFGNEPPGAAYKGNFQQLNILKSRHPHIQTFIAVGGWTWSDYFSDVMASSGTRQTFCQSLLDFVVTYGFDGADIDWEFPGSPGEGDNSYRPGGVDAQNFVTTLALCRPLFDAADKMLTVATPCDPTLYEHPGKGGEMDLAGMIPYLDWVNLMSYDLHGAWDPLTGHQSQLYLNPGDPVAPGNPAADPVRARFNQHDCAMGHLAEGVPLSKINLGIPFYGRSYAKVNQQSGGIPPVPGLFQPFQGVPKGTWDGGKWGTTGVFDYEDILVNILQKATAVRVYDYSSAVPTITWGLGRNQGMGFMSYDDRESTCAKSDYVLANDLGGISFWEFSGDIENHPDSLILSMYCGLNPAFSGCNNVCQP